LICPDGSGSHKTENEGLHTVKEIFFAVKLDGITIISLLQVSWVEVLIKLGNTQPLVAIGFYSPGFSSIKPL
ncbi:MAG: hypothetical protein U1C97_00605, partial [Candidatus Gracilibacteria bacterium]|nr:hypothetical protein [Candidatus Gracilibacteria bacterium]